MPARPARAMHIGLGAFHRSHQAWYTQQADDGWGITAFTGRTSAAARPLLEQDGLYTLLVRGPDADAVEVIGALSAVGNGGDAEAVARTIAAESTALVTMTITESGYRLGQDGRLDRSDEDVRADLHWLADSVRRRELFASGLPRTALARVLAGLELRRRHGGHPIALVPCDNIPGGGRLTRDALHALSDGNPVLQGFLDSAVSFVSTSVDRITPRATAIDAARVREMTGFEDNAVVVAEPYHDWVLEGNFPSGRPAWERAGARFVDDVAPFERRKLWLLNGAHSLLAYLGLLRRYRTVAEAVRDDEICRIMHVFWQEASRHLPHELDVPSYLEALRERFLNSRIEHRLEQIAQGGVEKLRTRIVPVLERELASGRSATGSLTAVAAWCILRTDESGAFAIGERPSAESTESLLGSLSSALGTPEIAADVDALASALRARRRVA